jgi:hypothetical protein
MNDKDRDLIAQILHAAGTAGERGFAYLVRFEWISGVTDALGWLTCAVFLGYLLHRLLKWHPEEDEAHIARAVGLIVCCIMIPVSISGVFDGFAQFVAPEGAAIRAALKH